MGKTFVLAILDGWGVGEVNESNPITMAAPPTVLDLEARFPSGALQAAGIAVGLPWEEEGNSEVGHLTIGAGKVLYQHYPRISTAIEDGSFFANPALTGAFAHARTHRSAVHIVGLLTAGNVHASLAHIEALMKMATKEKEVPVFLHPIADGRDSPPQSVGELVGKLKEIAGGAGEVVDVIGRYYAMNRDGHWDRSAEAYRLLVGGVAGRTFEEAMQRVYDRGTTDEFLEPATIGPPHPIRPGDALIFFNFREDSMRQLTEAFLDPAFDKFPVEPLPDLYLVTMTEYHKAFKAHVAFKEESVRTPLGKVLADAGLRQLRIAETQKYAHVTYFMNGFRNEPFPNEFRVLIPSLDLPHPEEKPEMMASAITDRALAALAEGSFDFILMNYANPDIVAHSGNFNATVEAVRVADRELGRLVQAVLGGNHTLLVTSDHGNAESILDPRTGEPETRHNTSPVPFYLVGRTFEGRGVPRTTPKLPTIGILSDVAPTILELLKLPKPEEMTGQSLLPQLLAS